MVDKGRLLEVARLTGLDKGEIKNEMAVFMVTLRGDEAVKYKALKCLHFYDDIPDNMM